MSLDITLGIYGHEFRPTHPVQMAAIGRTVDCSYDLVLIRERGTVHENINRVLDRARTRYLVILDDDAIPLRAGWLRGLVSALKLHPDVGIVGVPQMRNLRSIRSWCSGWLIVDEQAGCLVSWVPGYVMAIDRTRASWLRADEQIPSPVGMSDVDLCLQAQSRGLRCLIDPRWPVYHPVKPMPARGRAILEEQYKYMLRKWGSRTFAAVMNEPITWAVDLNDFGDARGLQEDQEDVADRLEKIGLLVENLERTLWKPPEWGPGHRVETRGREEPPDAPCAQVGPSLTILGGTPR